MRSFKKDQLEQLKYAKKFKKGRLNVKWLQLIPQDVWLGCTQVDCNSNFSWRDSRNNQEQYNNNLTDPYQESSQYLNNDFLCLQPVIYKVQWHFHLDLNEQTPTYCYIVIWRMEQEESSQMRTETILVQKSR